MTIKSSVLTALTNNKGLFLSGEDLSKRLNVSRAAVWKAIKTLREEGYPIEATTNKGYMLMEESWLITEDSLRLSLPSKLKNIPLHIFDTLDSTNTHAKQLAMGGAPHGTVIIAHQQTNGRGRLGRSFFSPKEGIYLSIIIKPDFDLSRGVLVTSAAAVAVAESIEEICNVSAAIKWVNDIYCNGKKVCGILSEGITDLETGQIESIIIGIGINTSTNGFPRELLNIVGAVEGNYSKSALTAAVISKTLDLVSSIEDKTFISAYRKKSLVIGKNISVYKGAYKTSPEHELTGRPARALDIDDNGGLMVMYTDGTRETLTTGEISIRLERKGNQ